MARCEGALRIDDIGESPRDVVEVVFVDGNRHGIGFEVENGLLDPVALDRCPEVLMPRHPRKPPRPAGRTRCRRGFRPRPSRLQVRQRDGIRRPPAPGARSVSRAGWHFPRDAPAGRRRSSVHRASRCPRHRSRKPQTLGDGGAPMAAGCDQAIGDLASVPHDVQDATAAAPASRIAWRCGTERSPSTLGRLSVSGLEIAFELDVVVDVELADPCRVAGTTEILHHHGIVEIAEVLALQPERRCRCAFRSTLNGHNGRPAALPSGRERG